MKSYTKRHIGLCVAISIWSLLCCSLVFAQTYNQFKPANGILKGSTTTYVTTAAAQSDILAFFTGTCNASTFLTGSGSCNNTLAATEPRLLFNATGQATDQKLWDLDLSALVFCLRTRTDADGAGANALCVTRGSTTTISTIVFGSGTSTSFGSGARNFNLTGGTTIASNVVLGLFSPATNTAALVTNSVQRLSVDGNGITTMTSGLVEAIRVVTAAGAVTAATTDRHICVNKTTGAATAVNLFATPTAGTVVSVEDCKGDASTNNITVTPAAGNIDGGATFVITTAYGAWTGIYTGTIWKTVASR